MLIFWLPVFYKVVVEMNNIVLEDLINKVRMYNPEEIANIKKAYEYADSLHKGQTRQSREPYIIITYQ